MMNRRLTLIYALHMLLFVLVVLGIAPRSVVLPWIAGILMYLAFVPTSEGLLFFIQTIPFFLALPLTEHYDNLNMWRLAALVIVARWLIVDGGFRMSWDAIRTSARAPLRAIRTYPTGALLCALFALAALSLLNAPHAAAGAIRIAYFVNIIAPSIVLWERIKAKSISAQSLFRSIRIAASLVILVGVLQVASTYAMDIYQFMRVWGEGIQFRQFGAEWSYIATHVGNTWFAYYGEQLSLRVFSTFTDSHTFPTYLLLALPALFALSLGVLARPERRARLWDMLRTRTRLSVVLLPLAMLLIILSGTRGIWAAYIPASMLALGIALWFPSISPERKNIFRYLVAWLVPFLLLFAIAYPIAISPQFLVSKGDFGLFGNRIRSIIDFGETSNNARLGIWRATLQSIQRQPMLGVGIGNYPVVLAQDMRLARAGSSAHNIYLHVAAEMGIGAFLILCGIFWRLWASALRASFSQKESEPETAYLAGMTLVLPWIYAYLLVDTTLLDERALLQFSVAAACVLAYSNAHQST